MSQPSEPLPIQTALCSFGMSGKVFHAPFLHTNPKFNLYGVWERTKILAEKIYPDIKTFRSYQEMLEDKEIELVIVNTPNSTHYEFASQALEAGKHIIVEKPFTVHSAEARELISLAEDNHLKLSVYQNRRYDSDYKVIKKVLQEGLLGEVVEAEFRFDRFKDKPSAKVHKETPGPGTGTLYDLGAHLIDQALQLFGMPEQIFADINKVRLFTEVDDYFELILFYNKKRVRLKSTYLARETVPEYIIHGTAGSFIKSRTDAQEDNLVAGKLPRGEDWGAEKESERGLLHVKQGEEIIRKKIQGERGNYHEYYNVLYAAIRKGGAVPVTGEEGLRVIEIIEAAYESHQKGCKVRIKK